MARKSDAIEVLVACCGGSTLKCTAAGCTRGIHPELEGARSEARGWGVGWIKQKKNKKKVGGGEGKRNPSIIVDAYLEIGGEGSTASKFPAAPLEESSGIVHSGGRTIPAGRTASAQSTTWLIVPTWLSFPFFFIYCICTTAVGNLQPTFDTLKDTDTAAHWHLFVNNQM